MKANKISIIVTLLLTIIFLLISVLFTYCLYLEENLPRLKPLIINISIGAFTSSFLAMSISLINYFTLRRHYIAEYVSMVNCFSIIFRPYYNLYLNKAERCPDIEFYYIQKWFDYLLNYFHKPTSELDFFFEKNKITKVMDETTDILYKIYLRSIKITNKKSLYDFGVITMDEFEDAKVVFFDSINNIDGIPTANILTQNFEKICKYCKLTSKRKFEYKDL